MSKIDDEKLLVSPRMLEVMKKLKDQGSHRTLFNPAQPVPVDKIREFTRRFLLERTKVKGPLQ